MKKNTIPVFKSEFSVGKSVLTLEKDDGGKEPKSIFSLYKDYLAPKGSEAKPPLFLVDDCLDGAIKAYENAGALKIPLRMGIRMDICDCRFSTDAEVKNSTHKIILFIKNLQGYTDLCRLWTTAALLTIEDRKPSCILDNKMLREGFTNNLSIAIPFYDSFIYNNNFTLRNCIPQFPMIAQGGSKEPTPVIPTFFIEDHDLPFDDMLRTDVLRSRDTLFPNSPVIETHTIYYEKRNHFKKYLVRRCIDESSCIEKPEIPHMCSDRFNLEDLCQKQI